MIFSTEISNACCLFFYLFLRLVKKLTHLMRAEEDLTLEAGEEVVLLQAVVDGAFDLGKV